MKRLIPPVVIALMAVGLAASTALAFPAIFDYSGHVRGNPSAFVAFSVKRADSGDRKVVGFTVGQVPYTCTDAPSGATDGWRFDERMRVKRDRTFEAGGEWVGQPLDPVGRVSGKLRRGGVAVGDFKLRGELGGAGTHCRTGLLEWRATKQQPPT
jgi:hypothetical protein